MYQFSAKNLRAAWLEWMSSLDVENAVAGTLTFKRTFKGRAVSEQVAGDAVRVFARMLQSTANGNRFKKGEVCLTFVAVNEGGREPGDKHPHVHFLAEVPDGWSTDAWINAVVKKIEKIEVFGSEHCVKHVLDRGWFDYMFKLSDKRNYGDSADIMSLWIKSSST